MPNKKSASKHLRQTVKLTEKNRLVKRNIKEIVKKGKKAIEDNSIEKQASTLSHQLQKAIDKAIKSNIIKENTGNRYKSRFAGMLKKAGVKMDKVTGPAKETAKTEDKK